MSHQSPTAIDTHCHAHFAAYQDESSAIAEESLHDDVWFITVGTQSLTSQNAVQFAEKFPRGVYASIGLHPSHLHAHSTDEDELCGAVNVERFDKMYYDNLAKSSKVVAVGECGIDLYHLPEGEDYETVVRLQEEQFLAQIVFAEQHDLPLIVHCRDAHDNTIRILQDVVRTHGLKRRGVIHSFTGGTKEAREYTSLGFALGFNGIITFPPRKKDPEMHLDLLRAATDTPDDLLLIETDAPYLTPIPHRGERNHPKYVLFVAEKLAELRGVSVSQILELTTRNAKRIFYKMK